MLMAFQAQGEEISPGLRSHAFGLSEAGGCRRESGTPRISSPERLGAQDGKRRPPSSPTPAVTLDVSDGKTARSFPEMLGRRLVRREHSLGPSRPQNHAAL